MKKAVAKGTILRWAGERGGKWSEREIVQALEGAVAQGRIQGLQAGLVGSYMQQNSELAATAAT